MGFKALIAKPVGRIMHQTMANLLGQKNISVTGLNFSEKFRQNGDLDPKWGPRGSDPQKTMENRSETPQINAKIEFYDPENYIKISFSERFHGPKRLKPETHPSLIIHYLQSTYLSLKKLQLIFFCTDRLNSCTFVYKYGGRAYRKTIAEGGCHTVEKSFRSKNSKISKNSF